MTNQGNMSDTSLDAYYSNQDTFANDEDKVLYFVFKNRNKTQVDAEEYMKKNRHTFSGRYTYLTKKGYIEKGMKVDVPGHKTKMYTYRITFAGRERLAQIIGKYE